MSKNDNLHFVATRNNLVRELGIATAAVDRRTTIPVLGNVKLKAIDSGQIEIAATDLELGIQTTCAAQVKAAGEATLPARRLLDYVRLLPDGEVEIWFGENLWASVTAGRSRTRIAGMGAENFPELPSAGEPLCSLSLRTLYRLIKQTVHAVSTEESRFTLNGALFEIQGGLVRMVATDGHRLALSEAPGPAQVEKRILVPRKALLEVVRLARVVDADAIVEFAADDNHLFFTLGDRQVIARRLTGNFPDYGRVLPKDFKGSATVARQQLHDALTRVRNFADERSRAVKLVFGSGQIRVFGSTHETGESEETVDAEVNGDVAIGFNAHYLIAFLDSTESDRVILSFKTNESAIQLAPEGDQEGRYICIVMPLRVQ